MKLLDRRTVLRGSLQGAMVALGLPLLEAMQSSRALACGGGLPKRFGTFLWGNGVLPDRWTPTGEGAVFTLSDQLAPLAAHQDVLTVVTGMGVKLPNVVPHGTGLSGILSGAPLSTDALESFTAASIDQVVADAIGTDTLYRSLQTAGTNTLGFSFSGENARNPAEQDPFTLFDRLFGATFVEPGSGGIVDPSLGLRRSVLDAVMGDLTTLQGRVSTADRVRLDQHLTGVRELEERLALFQEDPPDLEACLLPAEPLASYPDIDGRPQIGARNRALADLIAMSLACDQTRVFSHFLSAPVADILFEGAAAGHHSMTHDEPGDQPGVHDITLQCVGHYGEFVSALRAIPEGDGTLLDSCLVLGASEVSLGRTHLLEDLPVLVAGSGCGFLKPPFHYHSPSQENVSKLLLSLIRGMDIVAGEFGVDEARVTESLVEIEA